MGFCPEIIITRSKKYSSLYENHWLAYLLGIDVRLNDFISKDADCLVVGKKQGQFSEDRPGMLCETITARKVKSNHWYIATD